MSKFAIGVDTGATNIKLVLIDESGTIYHKTTAPTPKHDDPELVAAGLVDVVREFRSCEPVAKYEIEGIGFTVPQFFEGPDWVQRQANNMPSLEGYPLRIPLAEAFGDNIVLVNDLSSTGIAEHLFGKGAGCDSMFLLAIGTGIASAAVKKEVGLVRYSWNSTGDTGMIIVDPNGLAECTCGGRGCLEAVASAPAIRRHALREINRGRQTMLSTIFEENGDVQAHDVSNCAAAGDACAIDIMDQVGHFIGVALTSYLHIFAPTRIILAGGVAQAGDLLLNPIRKTMSRLASPWYLNRLESIDISELGKDGGAVGCASLILHPGKYL